jgi:hypothetical protein
MVKLKDNELEVNLDTYLIRRIHYVDYIVQTQTHTSNNTTHPSFSNTDQVYLMCLSSEFVQMHTKQDTLICTIHYQIFKPRDTQQNSHVSTTFNYPL